MQCISFFLEGDNIRLLHLCSQYKVILFDSYGTLIDVDDLLENTQNVISSTDLKLPTELINLWRAKQLDYTWLRSLMKNPMADSYQDFWVVTRDALKFSLAKLNISSTQSQLDNLMNGWLHLRLFPDVKESLTVLKKNYQLAILSNGTPHMLREVSKSNGLGDFISPANEISVDDVKVFKPHPSVYALAESKLRVSKSEILFVSGNSWDVIGAKTYGFESIWINRKNVPEDQLNTMADMQFPDLIQLTKRFGSS
ncbi:2-haloalkanoic acid dehalogenase-like isoform X2 [Bradysia coprophila]|uniref:2-haloalkanoic acid dehalogenase-like isoform X2 n=1 Tax=Bradysia coprophila TaxID=38358 RepID=UPI00187D8657|nr:2-haloalkanoic acid dehalogenase-like isoform X2 [Bradysia coprophila]